MEKPLRIAYRHLYSISSQKEESVSNMGWFEVGTWRWTLSWIRKLTTAEHAQLDQL